MSKTSTRTVRTERKTRSDRLGFRLDPKTKELIQRAAKLERRRLTAYCLTALTDAAQRTIDQHEHLQLSDRDRASFFDVLVNPPPVSERLERALATERRRVGR